jgi:hypothetical protein
MTEAHRIGLLEAIDNEKLLGAAFTPFPRQREALEWVETCIRNFWCMGRRSGKSSMAGAVLAWRAALCPHLRRYVQPGEDIYHVAVASNREQAQVTLGAARRLLTASPVLSRLVERDTDTELRLRDGHVLAAFVCSARTTRGFPIATLCLDEFGFFQTSDDGPAAAQNVYRATVPSMLQFASDRRLIVSSTPNGDNFFKVLFDQAWAEATTDE